MKSKTLLTLTLFISTFMYLHAQTQVIAHRGYWDTENSAQNSIVALYKAHEAGVYGSEFDVLITRDGIPVVNHDDILEDMLIEETDYVALRDIKLKNGEILPTLEQYLVHGKTCARTKLILEIKPHKSKENEDRAVSAVLNLVGEYDLHNRVEYISFSMNICKELIRVCPGATVAYLGGDVRPSEIKKTGLSGLDYHYSVFDKNPDWIKEAKDSGLFINVWTVNDEQTLQRLIQQDVDYITTDKPRLLKELLERM